LGREAGALELHGGVFDLEIFGGNSFDGGEQAFAFI
jgi:hypothetical protein